MSDDRTRMIEKITRKLTDEGKIVEAGWQSLRMLVLPPDTSPIQLSEMRKAFFCGACHLYGTIMTALEDGSIPTENDLRRIAQIHDELRAFEMDVLSQFKAGRG